MLSSSPAPSAMAEVMHLANTNTDANGAPAGCAPPVDADPNSRASRAYTPLRPPRAVTDLVGHQQQKKQQDDDRAVAVPSRNAFVDKYQAHDAWDDEEDEERPLRRKCFALPPILLQRWGLRQLTDLSSPTENTWQVCKSFVKKAIDAFFGS
jgi:hypothetical protein